MMVFLVSFLSILGVFELAVIFVVISILGTVTFLKIFLGL
jgi:hypothetical protein